MYLGKRAETYEEVHQKLIDDQTKINNMKKQLLFTALTLGATLTLNAQDVTNGLVSKYTFDNDSIQDVVGTNNGTTSDVLYSTGYGGSGKSIYFDGNDGSQSATVSRGLIEDPILSFNEDMTISFWFNIEELNSPNGMNILTSRRTLSGSEAGGIEFNVSGNNTNLFSVAGRTVSGGGGLTNEYIIQSAVLSTNQWYFGTFTQSGTVKKLYLNGVEVGENTNSNFAEQNLIWALGSSRRSDEADREFHGDIDEVRFYNRALSPAEVTQLYNYNPATAGIDEEVAGSVIKAYPNPMEDKLNFDITENAEFKLLDVFGKVIQQGTLFPGSSLDVSSLESAAYFVRLTTNKGTNRIKVIKK